MELEPGVGVVLRAQLAQHLARELERGAAVRRDHAAVGHRLRFHEVLGAAVMMGLFGVLTGVLSCLTAGSFDSFFETLGRCLLLGVAAAPMLSIPAAQMTRCLRQMKCPGAITLGILVTIRFIPVLLSEVRQISEAMKTRGVRTAWYRPGTVYRAFFIPLTMRVINISDSLSLSLETRGFAIENKEAAVFRPVRFRLRDALFAVGTAAASVGLAVMV